MRSSETAETAPIRLCRARIFVNGRALHRRRPWCTTSHYAPLQGFAAPLTFTTALLALTPAAAGAPERGPDLVLLGRGRRAGRVAWPCSRFGRAVRRPSASGRRAPSITSRAFASSPSTPTGAGTGRRSTTSCRCSSAQLLFAYAFDMLLAWSRGEEYVLGFGPFPIVFSTNLFLWFKDDWFALQFAADRARIHRQGVRALESRWPARAHLQSVGVHARGVFAGPARDRHDAPHLGTGDRHHLQPRARASTPCCSSSASSSCTSSRLRR